MEISCKSYRFDTKENKISPKTINCIFIGYAHNNKAYRFLVYESKNPDIHKNTVTSRFLDML